MRFGIKSSFLAYGNTRDPESDPWIGPLLADYAISQLPLYSRQSMKTHASTNNRVIIGSDRNN